MDKILNYINGEFIESKTDKWIPVTNPVSYANYNENT